MKTKTLRTIQEYLQPEIGRKIRIFSLGRKNNILIDKKRVQCSQLFWGFNFKWRGIQHLLQPLF